MVLTSVRLGPALSVLGLLSAHGNKLSVLGSQYPSAAPIAQKLQTRKKSSRLIREKKYLHFKERASWDEAIFDVPNFFTRVNVLGWLKF